MYRFEANKFLAFIFYYYNSISNVSALPIIIRGERVVIELY